VRPWLDRGRAALVAAGEPFASGRVLRATVDRREGERALAVVGDEGLDPGAARASATAWRWVVTHGRPVAVDVGLGRFALLTARPDLVDVHVQADTAGFDESRVALRARGTTHVLALPLSGEEGVVIGMIALEADVPAAAGHLFKPWLALGIELLDAASRWGPVLAGLPAAPAAGGPDGPGPAMARVLADLKRFAGTEETVLLCGPPGTGKSRLARRVHEWSARRARPFETVMLTAIPPTLVEGELFGWAPGAFSDAKKRRVGQVERADGGTLFLDELDKLPLDVQSRLLYLLEARRYRVLGDSGEERRADVRFVVATNADLPRMVREGRFLEDLFWRIDALRVDVPPLAQRRDEVPGWARGMLTRMHRGLVLEGNASFDAEAEDALRAWHWPGNLRELDSAVKRAYLAAVAEGAAADVVVHARHVAVALSGRSRGGPPVEQALRAAAVAWVDAAVDRHRQGQGPLGPDEARVLEDLVIVEACARMDPKAAFELLGMERWVQQRNHTRRLRDAEAAVAELALRWKR
jgi:DNA-binding NtrC family response regulator